MHIKRVSVQWGFTVQVVLPFPSGIVGHLAKHTKHTCLRVSLILLSQRKN